jgi:hypothetical protein
MICGSSEKSQPIRIYVSGAVAHIVYLGELVYFRINAEAAGFEETDAQVGVGKFPRNGYASRSSADDAEIGFNISFRFDFTRI